MSYGAAAAGGAAAAAIKASGAIVHVEPGDFEVILSRAEDRQFVTGRNACPPVCFS